MQYDAFKEGHKTQRTIGWSNIYSTHNITILIPFTSKNECGTVLLRRDVNKNHTHTRSITTQITVFEAFRNAPVQKSIKE